MHNADLQEAQNQNAIRAFFILCLVSLGFLVGCKSKTHTIYSNDLLGLQMEVPFDWDVEETERVLSILVNPSRGSDKDSVSITILSNMNIEENLHDALEDEIHHLKTRWSIDEMTMVAPAREGTLNGFNYTKITVEAPVRSQIEEGMGAYNSFQPMDILVLDAGDRYIVIYFRKSTINANLNDEGQTILDSIRVYP